MIRVKLDKVVGRSGVIMEIFKSYYNSWIDRVCDMIGYWRG